MLSPAIRQQSGLLSQRHDPTRPALYRFIECRPGNPVVTSKGDQLFDVGVRVIPLLHHVLQVELRPVAIMVYENEIGTPSTDSGL
jgi:hypothetical protein